MQEIDSAVQYLVEHQCWRDGGLWFSVDGPLDSDPIEAAKALRRLVVQRGIAASKNARGIMTRGSREFTPNGVR